MCFCLSLAYHGIKSNPPPQAPPIHDAALINIPNLGIVAIGAGGEIDSNYAKLSKLVWRISFGTLGSTNVQPLDILNFGSEPIVYPDGVWLHFSSQVVSICDRKFLVGNS